MRKRLLLLVFIALTQAATAAGAPVQAADRLVLRNLQIINDCTVTSFDEDGVVLAEARPGGTNRVRWDEIERGKIAAERQGEFDALLQELGTPLYRIRQRLNFGDYASLLEPAAAMYPRFATRKSETAYMVCQALMWARLAVSQREAAVEPYLRCYDQLRSRAAKIGGIPGPRRLRLDAKSGLSPELTPVWFDAAAAAKALPAVKQACEALSPQPPGATLYYATLALAAGDAKAAELALAGLATEPVAIAEWRRIVPAQAEVLAAAPGKAVAELHLYRNDLSAATRPAGLYWLGMAGLQASGETEQRQGLLDLVTLVTLYGKQEPELAAAALYQAAAGLDKLKDDSGGAALRQELLQKYAGTAHATLLRGAKGRR